jgi:hypothetical protein
MDGLALESHGEWPGTVVDSKTRESLGTAKVMDRASRMMHLARQR